MGKYIFKKLKDENNHFDTTTVTMEVETCGLVELIEAFEEFLAASGFGMNKLDIVDNDEVLDGEG
jgi:hypothetical protein